MLQVMIVRYRMTQDKLLLAGLLDRYAELEKMWREEIRTAIGYDPNVRVKKDCVICGTDIWVKPSHSEQEGTYCSTSCMSRGYTERLAGNKNPNYRHGQSGTRHWKNARSQMWRSNNPNKIRHSNRQTKARRRKAEGSHSLGDIDFLMREQRGCCVYCDTNIAEQFHVDHIIPIIKGGTNYAGNLQLLCPSCNVRKSHRLPVEYKKVIGYYDGLL